MKILLYIPVILMIVFFLVSHSAFANNIPGFSLDQAIDQALEKNRTYDNVQKSLKEAELKYRSITKERLPKISTNYSYTKTFDDMSITASAPSIDNPNIMQSYSIDIPTDNYLWYTSLSMPIFTGGMQELQESIAKLGIDIAKLQILQAKTELIMNVKGYYYNVIRNSKFVDFLEQNLKCYQEHESLTNKYHAQGIVAKNSVLEAKVELSNAQQELATARQNFDISKGVLKLAMGSFDFDDNVNLTDSLIKNKFDIGMKECAESALKNNPEIVAFIFLKQQAEKAIRLETAQYNPTLSLNAYYMKYSDKANLSNQDLPFNNATLNAMLSINWLLLDWGQHADQAKIKRIHLDQLINNEKQATDKLKLRIKESYAMLQTAENNIETSEFSIEHAKENLRIANLRYREQAAPAKEVIDAISALKRSEYNYFTSLYNYNVAVAQIEQAMGKDIKRIINSQKSGK